MSRTGRLFGDDRGAPLVIAGTSLLGAGLAFFSSVLIALAVGPQGRGQIAVSLQCAYVLTPLLTLGIDRLALRGGELAAAPWAAVLRRSVLLALSCTLFMAVAAVFGFSPGGLGWELAIAPAIALVTSSLALIRGIAIGRRNLRVFVAWDLSVDALWLASFTLLWWFNVNSAVVWAAVYAIPGVALAYWVAIGFRRPWPEGRSFIRQSLPLVPAGFATILMLRMDRLFLPIQCSTTDLGLYVVAATTMEAASWIVAAHADWIVKRLTERGVGSVHPLTVLADAWWVPFLVLLAGLVASLWLLPFLGPSFEAARPLLIPLGVATLVLSVMRYLQAILVSTPTPSLSSWAAGIAAVSGLVVYPMLISRSCAPGAAWGSAIVYGIGALASLVLIQSARRASRDRF